MQRNSESLNRAKIASFVAFSVMTACVSGCGRPWTAANLSTAVTAENTAVQSGHVFGGPSAVKNASLQVYSVGVSSVGGAAQSLLPHPVTSDTNGVFTLPSFSCPDSQQSVYVVASGGDGGKGPNRNLALMAAVGDCSKLGNTSLTVNEVTTVAAVYALAPFMTSATAVGSTPANQRGLMQAFATAARLADISKGSSPGNLPAKAVAPVATINTLANILSACVDTAGGTAQDGSACGKLFAAATPAAGSAPTDTVSALLNIARNPQHEVANLLALVPAKPPFTPSLSAGNDLTLAIKYKPSLSRPSAAAFDAGGNLWITNSGSNSVSVVDGSGNLLTPAPIQAGSIAKPSSIAIDTAGRAWVANEETGTLSVLTYDATGTEVKVPGLSAPSSLSFDANGRLWIANQGNSTVTAVDLLGMEVQSTVTITNGGLLAPTTIVANPN